MQSVIGHIAPSQAALRRAAELGREMARHKTGCRPETSSAYHYENYLRFRNAQRDLMEHNEAFSQRWLEKLFAVADREGRAAGLRMDDSMASWDIWYNKLVVPLKEVFWRAWEQACDLPGRYAEARHLACDVAEAPAVLRVAALGADAQPPTPDLAEAGLAQGEDETGHLLGLGSVKPGNWDMAEGPMSA